MVSPVCEYIAAKALPHFFLHGLTEAIKDEFAFEHLPQAVEEAIHLDLQIKSRLQVQRLKKPSPCDLYPSLQCAILDPVSSPGPGSGIIPDPVSGNVSHQVSSVPPDPACSLAPPQVWPQASR